MTVDVSDFVDGVGFGLHPTSDPIVVTTTAAADALKVCPANSDLTTVGGIEECDALDPEEPTELPATSGELHVGVLIITDAADPATGVVGIDWTGVDSFFAVQPGPVEPSASRSITMTSTAAGEVAASFRPDGAWELEFTGPGSASAKAGLGDDDTSLVRVVLAEHVEAGEWTLTYSNRSDRAQTPVIYVEWPVGDDSS